MVSAAKAFSKEPPKRPLTDLAAITEDFKWRYVDRQKTDQVIEYCRDASKFSEAVRRAVEARDANGKHHNHQSKVDITARRKFGATIISLKGQVKRSVQWNDANPVKTGYDDDAFDMIHDLFDEHKPYGIGPVTVYDVAVRVGAYMGIEPAKVYMHAGVKQGIVALGTGLDNKAGRRLLDAAKLKRVPLYLFPKDWRGERADDIEDMLCTYREVFLGW